MTTTLQFDMGSYTYFANPNSYYLKSSVRSDPEDIVKSYDHMLHRWLDKIFRECYRSNSGQIKQFLRGLRHNTDPTSIIKPLLELEPILSKYFLKEELGKLSLLWIAVIAGYSDSVELLVRSGADVNELFGRHNPQVIDEKWTILHVLVQMHYSPENERLIRLVIDHGADLQARDRRGRTVLHHAVIKGQVQLTKILLEHVGPGVNATDDLAETPLFIAASHSKADELVPLLMYHGADVFVKSRLRQNVLHRLACVPGKHVNVDLARVWIEMGVSVDEQEDSNLYQPIHIAARTGKIELAKLFLYHGANVNALTKSGKSPLYIAAQYGNNKVVETMLNRGANVDLTTTKGRTALHASCKYVAGLPPQFLQEICNSEDTIRLLLCVGADMVAEDNAGKTPLAFIASDEENTKQLITRLMIKMLALKKVCQPSVELRDKRIIERYPKLWTFYQKCIHRIEKMKFNWFVGTCTFFDLLTKSQCEIAALMQNPDFETMFKCYQLNDGFSIYAEELARAFYRAQEHYRSLLEQANVINEAVYNALPYLVVKKVVDHIFNNCCSKNVK